MPLIFQLVFSLVLSVLLKQAEYEGQLEVHARQVDAHLNYLATLANGLAQSELTYFETGFTGELKTCDLALKTLRQEIEELRRLARDNANQEEIIQNMDTIYAALLNEYEVALSMPLADKERWHSSLLKTWENTGLLRTQMQRFFLYESLAEGNQLQAKADWRERLKSMVMLATVADVVLAAFLAAFFSFQVVKRLSVLSENSARLAKDQPLLPVLAGQDEIVNLDRVFHQMADELAEARKRREEFIAMISHDLRTPLTSLRGGLAVLAAGAGGQLNERGQRITATGERSLDRLIRLINDLLDMAKLEAGKFDLTMAAVDVKDIVERGLAEIKPLAEEKSLQFRVDDLASVQVPADEARLLQVIVNLLGNAVKFSPDGATIGVSAKRDGDWLEVQISDEGPGIADADIGRIFDRFRQLPQGAVKKGSSGLGLAISKALVEQHGGTIGVKSVLGAGKHFLA